MMKVTSVEEKMREVFDLAFDVLAKTKKTITFNPHWHNGTGYLDGAVDGKHAPMLKPFERVCFTSDDKRRGILIGTHWGNISLFERYQSNKKEFGICLNLADDFYATWAWNVNILHPALTECSPLLALITLLSLSDYKKWDGFISNNRHYSRNSKKDQEYVAKVLSNIA